MQAARESDVYGREQQSYGLAYGERQDYLNRLHAGAGIGQTTSNTLAQTGANTASNISNLTVAGANSIAQGQQNAANAYAAAGLGVGNAAGSAVNQYVMYKALT